MNQMASVPLHPPPGLVSFSGDRTEFRALVERGAALEVITVGFYRFWLATDIRRHLWSNTHIEDDAFEYTGRGKELLIGFLFALAIIMPVYLAYFFISLEAARLKAFTSLPLLSFFYVFGQFAIYRARRYRLTRTVWRGVRFWMSGSGWSYAARAALWGLLALVTLGLALPWREAALERYKMRHSYYGDLQGSFEGTGWEFFKRGWWLWLLAVVPLMMVMASPLFRFIPRLLPMAKTATQIGGFATFLMVLLAPFIYGLFKAVEWRWWISGIRFGAVSLESALPRGALISLYWKVIGWLLLLATLLAVYLFACTTLIGGMSNLASSARNLQGNVPIIVLAAIGYLAFILLMNIVMRVYLLRDLWVRLVVSTSVHHVAAAADVSVEGDLASAVGEGLADGLDVVGF
jgi:uncharacterized membrane protein YjgN (DUF898 family)